MLLPIVSKGWAMRWGGAAVVVAGAMLSFLRGVSGEKPLSGMPLTAMPEMFVAIGGLFLVVLGSAEKGEFSTVRFTARRRRWVAAIGTVALTVDISKTSTLGFVIPGMRAEYGIGPGVGALLAVSGLSGTAIGTVLFARVADRIGRRRAYLLATLGFTATSLCGCMPTFTGNLVMCFAMGTAVGGLAPLLIALLTDVIGTPARGAVVVALSVVGAAAGYLVAAGCALWLEPAFGWRVLWLIGAPAGFVLAMATPWIPDGVPAGRGAPVVVENRVLTSRVQRIHAALIGVLAFGLTTWVPSLARAGGLAVGTANLLLTATGGAMIPCAVVLLLLYRRFGPAVVVMGLAAVMALLLLTLTVTGVSSTPSWLCAGALVSALFCVNAMTAVVLPVAADLAESPRRGRTTATVSLCNRLGGLCGPLLLAALVSSVSDVFVAVTVLALLCAGMAGYLGRRQSVDTREEIP